MVGRPSAYSHRTFCKLCCQELWALIMDAGTGFTAQARLALLIACIGLK